VDEIDELRRQVRDAAEREAAAKQREWEALLARIRKVEEQLSEFTTERDKFRGAITLLRLGYVIVGGILVELLRKIWNP
jgi:chromosome segregation ATPase